MGWSEDMKQLATRLYLPPGWELFYASGVDEQSPTWLTTWTLLEALLILAFGAVVGKLYKPAWGVVAALALVAVHGSTTVPRAAGLVLLVLVAALRFVPKGVVRQGLRVLWVGTSIVLGVLTARYCVAELRVALFPMAQPAPWQITAERDMEAKETEQLAEVAADGRDGGTGTRAKGEEGSMGGAPRLLGPAGRASGRDQGDIRARRVTGNRYGVAAEAQTADPHVARQAVMRDAAEFGMIGLLSPGAATPGMAQDPKAVIQTGPGVPEWQWQYADS